MTTGQKLRLAMLLSVPAVIAQLSSIVMQYIDAAMVGHLGAEASASIGLVSTSTWLFSGMCGAAATGFSVQVAQHTFCYAFCSMVLGTGGQKMLLSGSFSRAALLRMCCCTVL